MTKRLLLMGLGAVMISAVGIALVCQFGNLVPRPGASRRRAGDG